RFTGCDVFQTHHRSDVAGENFFDLGTAIRVHLQNSPDTHYLALVRVIDRFASVQYAGVNAHEGQLTNERVSHELECQRGELGVVVGRQADDIAVVVGTFHRGDVHRRGQVIDNGVEHALHALVLESRTAEHGLNFAGDGTQTQTLVDLGFGQFTGLEILVHQLFVGFRGGFNELFPPLGGFVSQFGRDVDVLELRAVASFVPDNAFHLDQVDNALEGVFGADWDDDRHRVGLQTQLELVVNLEEVRAGTVHLVNERQTRHVVLVGLAPNRFR